MEQDRKIKEEKNYKSIGERTSQLQKEGYALDSDEVRDVIEEDVFKDDKEALDDIRLKRVLKEKIKKGLLSEKEIDNLVGTLLGADKLIKDEENQIDVKEAEVDIEGIRRNQEHLKKRLNEYELAETDEEKNKFLSSLRGKVNSPEVSEKNTHEREQRERNIQSIERQNVDSMVQNQEPKAME